MRDLRPMLSNKILYNRLINCIVKNSYLKYFLPINTLSMEIVSTCIDSMYKIPTNKNKKIFDFFCQVELYRDTIIRNSNEFSRDKSLIFESPRQELELRIFQFFDSKMSVIRRLVMRKNKLGQWPKSLPIVVIKQAALHVNKLSLEYNSSDDYLKYVLSVYQVVGRKWWQSRITDVENVSPILHEAEDSMDSPLSLKRTYSFNELPLKVKRTQQDRKPVAFTKRILMNLGSQDVIPKEIQTKRAESLQSIDETNTKEVQPEAEYKIIAYNRPSLTITIQKRSASTLRGPS